MLEIICHYKAHPHVLIVNAMHGGGVVKKHLPFYGTSLCIITWWCLVTNQLKEMCSY
jgi:hypothetical protein